MDKPAIADVIRQIREEIGLSQAELGKLIPVDRAAVWRWERAENTPAYETALQIARLPQVTRLRKYQLLGGYGKSNADIQRDLGSLHSPIEKHIIHRHELIRRISEVSEKAIAEKRAIVIQGPPGIGKSTLLRLCQAGEVFEMNFTRVESLPMPSHDRSISDWAVFIMEAKQIANPADSNNPVVPDFVVKTPKRKRLLLDIDNCWNSQAALEVLSYLPLGSLLIVATRDRDVAAQITSGEFIFGLEEFSRDEIRSYVSVRLSKIPEEQVDLLAEQLKQLAGGNPKILSILITLIELDGMEHVLTSLQSVAEGKGVINATFSDILQLAFDTLSPLLQERITALAILPRLAYLDRSTLAELWGVDVAEAQLTLARIQGESGLIVQRPELLDGWEMHDLVLGFLKEKFELLSDLERQKINNRIMAIVESEYAKEELKKIKRALPRLDPREFDRRRNRVITRRTRIGSARIRGKNFPDALSAVPYHIEKAYGFSSHWTHIREYIAHLPLKDYVICQRYWRETKWVRSLGLALFVSSLLTLMVAVLALLNSNFSSYLVSALPQFFAPVFLLTIAFISSAWITVNWSGIIQMDLLWVQVWEKIFANTEEK